MTWRSSGLPLGAASTPIPASRLWGSATGRVGRKRLGKPNGRRAIVGPQVRIWHARDRRSSLWSRGQRLTGGAR
jgi:hypothetical protein